MIIFSKYSSHNLYHHRNIIYIMVYLFLRCIITNLFDCLGDSMEWLKIKLILIYLIFTRYTSRQSFSYGSKTYWFMKGLGVQYINNLTNFVHKDAICSNQVSQPLQFKSVVAGVTASTNRICIHISMKCYVSPKLF